jgi:hypothetical protein
MEMLLEQEKEGIISACEFRRSESQETRFFLA